MAKRTPDGEEPFNPVRHWFEGGTEDRQPKGVLAVDYEPFLLERLKDLDYAAGYLSECLEQGENTFLLGLSSVIEAQGDESLNKILTGKGGRRFSKITSVLEELGLRFCVERKQES
jgi:DNA-binding phage protein